MGGSAGRRGLLFPMAILLGLIYIVIACLSGYLFNRYVDAGLNQAAILGVPTNHGDDSFVANAVVLYLILFTLIASMVGLASSIMGTYHGARFRDHSASGAAAAHWIALLLNLLAFGIACKTLERSHIGGGNIGRIVKTVASLQIIAGVLQLLYTIMHHLVPTNDVDNNNYPRTTTSAPAGVGMTGVKHHHTTGAADIV